jgi:hypothetical protein
MARIRAERAQQEIAVVPLSPRNQAAENNPLV